MTNAVGWQDLKDLFRGAGNVQRANIIQGRDGRSKGHGIVLFATVEDARKAIELYDKYMWHGRVLEVREDRNLPDFAPSQPVTMSAAIAASSEDVDKLVDAVEKKLTVTDSDQKGASTSTDESKSANTSSGLEGGAAADASAREGAEGTSTFSLATPPVRPVFVSNIPFRLRWQDLKDLFRQAGHVVRAEVALGPDRRSRGHGTVLFSTQEEADKAIAMFDQYQWQDRILRVQEDRVRSDGHGHNEGAGYNQGFRPNFIPHGPPGPFFRGHPPVNQNLIGRQVFVGNLPFPCQWQDLKDLFRKAGNIIRADVVLDFNGRSRGFGSVLFATQEDAKNAIEMFDNFGYNGRRLRVHLDKFTSMPHGPPMHGGVVPHLMRPNGPPPHHPHPHHPHHRMHPMHPQPGPGFLGTFGPPGIMNLGPHPMVHNGSPQGQYGMPPPQFPGRPYSPPMMMHGPAGSGPEFMGTEGFHRSEGMPPMGDMVKSPPPFDPGSSVPVSAEAHGVGGTSGPAISGPGGIPAHPGSPSQQYPFLPNLGPIGKPNISNGGVGSTGMGSHGAGANGTGDDSSHMDYGHVQGYGADVPFDGDGVNAYSPHFYITNIWVRLKTKTKVQDRNSRTHSHPRHKGKGKDKDKGRVKVKVRGKGRGKGKGSRDHQSHLLASQQSPVRGSVYGSGGGGGVGPYQDHPYSPDPTGLSPPPFSGSIGALPGMTTAGGAAGVGVTGGGMSGRGYPTQPDWMGPPAPFGMGPYHHHHHHHHPPQPMYGSPSTFAPYGQGNGNQGNQDTSEFTEA
ncbi:hypothetical protein DFQ27_003999 [Actinomortierella ambigua]|uniref:RRM domain-containing protein n=1 Tax=Actinomortierella ambigua TaxID=1343610 RepID=A0A9P6UCE0_9FUNG|nr:hypothetical protein DFQ27_003999 [Actinomortierella ambigua]